MDKLALIFTFLIDLLTLGLNYKARKHLEKKQDETKKDGNENE